MLLKTLNLGTCNDNSGSICQVRTLIFFDLIALNWIGCELVGSSTHS